MAVYPTQNYAVFDLETSGLDTNNCHIIEVAVKTVTIEGESKRSWLIKTPGLKLSEEVTSITGITDELLHSEGLPAAAVFGELAQIIAGRHLVAHNGFRFDLPILTRHLHIHKPEMLLNPDRLIDTAALFRAWNLREEQYYYETHRQFAARILSLRAFGKYNLQYACQSLNLTLDGLALHRASGDVEMTDRLYRALCNGSLMAAEVATGG
jgi:DNA polymerase III alpha subunit (gram-positive type)